jgi:hypothetical protein
MSRRLLEIQEGESGQRRVVRHTPIHPGDVMYRAAKDGISRALNRAKLNDDDEKNERKRGRDLIAESFELVSICLETHR